jgi:hypothetical protein
MASYGILYDHTALHIPVTKVSKLGCHGEPLQAYALMLGQRSPSRKLTRDTCSDQSYKCTQVLLHLQYCRHLD